MDFIDTHTHLYDEAFGTDSQEAVARAKENGVCKMILPDIDSSSREAMFSLAGKFHGTLFPCLGLHPTSIDARWEEEYSEMLRFRDRQFYAIGETGIDCYWSKEFVQEQKESLKRHFELAHETGLPIIIHSREATSLVFEVMDRCRRLDVRGVFHAFSGSLETFRTLTGYGDWYVGIGGVVTYRNASIAETIKRIPLDRIVLETDSPYLTPVPFRGKRNESSFIPHIAKKIAEQKGVTVEEVAETTTRNAMELFGLQSHI